MKNDLDPMSGIIIGIAGGIILWVMFMVWVWPHVGQWFKWFAY